MNATVKTNTDDDANTLLLEAIRRQESLEKQIDILDVVLNFTSPEKPLRVAAENMHADLTAQYADNAILSEKLSTVFGLNKEQIHGYDGHVEDYLRLIRDEQEPININDARYHAGLDYVGFAA